MSRRSTVKRAKVDRGRRIVSFCFAHPLSIRPGEWVTLSIMPGVYLRFVGANADGRHQFMRPRQRR